MKRKRMMRISSIFIFGAIVIFIFSSWWEFPSRKPSVERGGVTVAISRQRNRRATNDAALGPPTMMVVDPDGGKTLNPESKRFMTGILKVSPQFEPRAMYPNGDYPFYYRIKLTQTSDKLFFLRGTWVVELTVKRQGKVVKQFLRSRPGCLVDQSSNVQYLNLCMRSDTLPELGEYELSATLYAFPDVLSRNQSSAVEALANKDNLLHAEMKLDTFKTQRVESLPDDYYTLFKDPTKALEVKEILKSVIASKQKTIFVDRDGKQTVKSVRDSLRLNFTRPPSCDLAYEVWGISDVAYAKDKSQWRKLGRMTASENYIDAAFDGTVEPDAKNIKLRLVPCREAAWFAVSAFRRFLGEKIITGWLPIMRKDTGGKQ